MLTLFLRSILMYGFVFLILRLTGKRQVSDLQPFDLLITLLIADLAGSAIADTGTPLVYSVVPILGMYLAQQLVTYVCLKNERARRIICGSPVILVRDGVVSEHAMRDANYTLVDLLDQLRASGIFDLSEAAFAILETNGTMSVLPRSAVQPPTRAELCLRAPDAELSYMLILDGSLCRNAMQTLSYSEADVLAILHTCDAPRVKDVFFLHRAPDGTCLLQLKERAGGRQYRIEGRLATCTIR